MNDYKDILAEIIDEAVLALHSEFDSVRAQALAKIHDAIESALPVDGPHVASRKRRAGILTPEQELADTIARQKEVE